MEEKNEEIYNQSSNNYLYNWNNLWEYYWEVCAMKIRNLTKDKIEKAKKLNSEAKKIIKESKREVNKLRVLFYN